MYFNLFSHIDVLSWVLVNFPRHLNCQSLITEKSYKHNISLVVNSEDELYNNFKKGQDINCHLYVEDKFFFDVSLDLVISWPSFLIIFMIFPMKKKENFLVFIEREVLNWNLTSHTRANKMFCKKRQINIFVQQVFYCIILIYIP